MSNESDRSSLRLAELVAALSLGVDLGFGQPIEHVLRQCLIALRLAERIGLGDRERADVYYTALLVNVGCHSDAHEQAKWFGDDIALKPGKYGYEPGSVRGAAAAFRLVGSGNPPLHRFRVALEFMLAGCRGVEDRIEPTQRGSNPAHEVEVANSRTALPGCAAKGPHVGAFSFRPLGVTLARNGHGYEVRLRLDGENARPLVSLFDAVGRWLSDDKQNTARVLKDVAADVQAVVEAESRVALRHSRTCSCPTWPAAPSIT